MRLTSAAPILAALMCGAAVAGYSYKVGPEPQPNRGFFCGNDDRVSLPCAINENVAANSPQCVLPTEAAFREARAKALAPDESRLRRAVDDLDMQQAVWAWRRVSRTEESYDRMYAELKDYWASGSEFSPPWSR